MKLTFIAAIQLFASGAVLAGWLDMQVVKELRIHSPRFGSESFANYNMKRAARLAPLNYLLGKKTIEFMKTRTFLFPFVELAFGGLVVLSAYIHGLGARWIGDCIFFGFALPLSMISWIAEDAGRVAPDKLTIPGTLAGVLTSLIFGSLPRVAAGIANRVSLYSFVPQRFREIEMSLRPESFGLINSIVGSLCMGGLLSLVAEGYFRARGREGMGLGAVKTGFMVGSFCGLAGGLLAILTGCLLGTFIGMYCMWILKKGRDYELPFASHLAIGGMVAILWGDRIISWYMKFAGVSNR